MIAQKNIALLSSHFHYRHRIASTSHQVLLVLMMWIFLQKERKKKIWKWKWKERQQQQWKIRSNKYYDNCVVNFFVILPSQFHKNIYQQQRCAYALRMRHVVFFYVLQLKLLLDMSKPQLFISNLISMQALHIGSSLESEENLNLIVLSTLSIIIIFFFIIFDSS